MGDSSTSTQTSSDATLSPFSQQQYEDISGNVGSILNGNSTAAYTPYTGQLVAPTNALETQGANLAQANTSAGQGLLGNAAQGATAAQGYAPAQVTPQTLAGTNLSPYENPYQSSVVNATMNELNLENQQQLNNEASQFTADGAFGGARQGVADAQTNNLFANTAASTLAQLNAGNYSQAQQAAEGDIANNLQAQTANQSAGIQGSDLNLAGSSLLGNLATTQQTLGTNAANELNLFGLEQQGTNTQADQAASAQYQLGQITPLQQAQIQLGLLGETPMLQDTTGTSNTQSSPSILSSLGSLFGGGGSGGGSGGSASGMASAAMMLAAFL